MKFIRYILSHLSLLLVLGLVVAVIYFRAALFPEHINRPVDRALTALEEKFEMEIPKHLHAGKPFFAQPYFAQDDEQEKSIVDFAETNQQSTEIVYAEPVIDQLPEEINEAPRDKEQDMMTVVEKIKETVEETVNEMIDSVSVEKEEETKETESSESIQSENLAILNKARQAYWNGDMKEAEKAYQELSELTTQDPNIFGELGNVYYAQGKWKQAGEAYYEAAVLLIELNQLTQVNYLLRIIQGLDVESAEKLRQKMTG